MALPILKPKLYLPLLFLLLAAMAGLGVYIYQQQGIIRDMDARSEVALSRFLKTVVPNSGPPNDGVDLYLHNTEFSWSKKVHIDVGRLNARAVPLYSSRVVNFDDLNSFVVELGESDIRILPNVLEGMFNESVFNYPGSKLRNLSVTLVPEKGEHKIQLAGSIHYLFWIPFRMISKLTIDPKSNTLVMSVEKLRVFGFIPVTPFIALKPFNLDKILTVPANKHLTVSHNKIMIKPFGLFPPPRITGQFEKIAVNDRYVLISFAAPAKVKTGQGKASLKNGIFLNHGLTKFQQLSMQNTNITVVDATPADPFAFNILSYAGQLPKSKIKLNQGASQIQSVTVTMPDVNR